MGKKKKELLIHKTAWINLKNITVSKRNETHKQHILHDSTVWNQEYTKLIYGYRHQKKLKKMTGKRPI